MITASPGCYLPLSSVTQRPPGRPARCIRRAAVSARTFDGPAVDLRWTWHVPGTEAGGRSDIKVTCALRPKTGDPERTPAPGLVRAENLVHVMRPGGIR
jgi:hypothetical protein